MSKIWYCPNCGYEVDRGGRCHSCRDPLVVSPLPELVATDGDDEVGYRLDEWEDALRGELIDALIDHEILHRFEEDDLVVAAKDESVVDELIAELTGRSLEEVASGAVADDDAEEGDAGPPLDEESLAVLRGLLDAARRLEADATDMIADADLGEASALLFLMDEAPGVDPETWAAVGRVTRRLLGALGAEEALDAEIANQAAVLTRLLAPVLEPQPASLALGQARVGERSSSGGGREASGTIVTARADESAASEPDLGSAADEATSGDEGRAGDAETEEMVSDALDDGPDGLADDEDLVYEMTEWLPEQRAELALALERAGIAYQWEGDDLVVPAEREAEVDVLFEQVQGSAEDDVDDEERYHALEELFGASDRLAHDPDDEEKRQETLDAVEAVVEGPAPFALDDAQWWQIRTRARSVADAISDDTPTEQLRRQAVVLRDLLRELV